MTGIVLRSSGGVYEVETAEGVHEALLRGRLKLESRVGDRVVVGDRVEIEAATPGPAWTIEHVDERHSALVRRAPGKAPKAKVIVANLHRVVVVFASADPEPHLRMLDRFLVLAESSDLDAVVVANKIDLLGQAAARARFHVYEEIGYRVVFTSAKTGLGVGELREILCEGISTLTGPSGVGKSSLLNAVQPGLGLRVSAVSERVRKGRHTTVTAELIHLECGGYVADTPGLREIGLWGVDLDELGLYFPEFEPYLGHCRYRNSCTHSHEPGCSVRAAAERGEIAESRFDSYLRLVHGDDLDGA
ncbi:MAG: ribosome small subunit-dependent GTPase A [Gemmatimonas sp.]|nr:ribosome small subunit-dependent GTPase A [Gemmatimonas sp.]